MFYFDYEGQKINGCEDLVSWVSSITVDEPDFRPEDFYNMKSVLIKNDSSHVEFDVMLNCPFSCKVGELVGDKTVISVALNYDDSREFENQLKNLV
jgi:hypothetical protein